MYLLNDFHAPQERSLEDKHYGFNAYRQQSERVQKRARIGQLQRPCSLYVSNAIPVTHACGACVYNNTPRGGPGDEVAVVTMAVAETVAVAVAVAVSSSPPPSSSSSSQSRVLVKFIRHDDTRPALYVASSLPRRGKKNTVNILLFRISLENSREQFALIESQQYH